MVYYRAMPVSLPIVNERSCQGCAKCCEGWLAADIKGYKMGPGKPCFYLSKDPLGCSDYASRPVDPCVRYRCAWLDEGDMPLELKPSNSNLVVTRRVRRELREDGLCEEEYYEVIVAGEENEEVYYALDLLDAWALPRGVKLQPW